MRKKAGTDDTIPAVIPNEMASKEFRQNWARLIQKIYEVDPLICLKCQGQMKIISFIEELDIKDPSAPGALGYPQPRCGIQSVLFPVGRFRSVI
jgi:hypothetical protein